MYARHLFFITKSIIIRMVMNMYAMKLLPCFKDYLWGGDRLCKEFGYNSGLDKTAEAWVLSCHKDGENKILNGEYKDLLLSDVLKLHPEYVGGGYEAKDGFPILIKLIDAKDNLSLQVHPHEEYARRVEGEHGKTEAWYILDCEDGAELIAGFKKKYSREEVEAAVYDGEILSLANKTSVKKGDLYFIPAGTLHAIGKGILIFEIQQNSNSTYRVYDYGRLLNGQPRELHKDKALDVLKREKYSFADNVRQSGENGDGIRNYLIRCDIFSLSRLDVKGEVSLVCGEKSFNSVVCIAGEGELLSGKEKMTVKKGDSIFIPAGFGNYSLRGNISVLLSECT